MRSSTGGENNLALVSLDQIQVVVRSSSVVDCLFVCLFGGLGHYSLLCIRWLSMSGCPASSFLHRSAGRRSAG